MDRKTDRQKEMDWITSTRSKRFLWGPFYAKLWPTHRQTDTETHSTQTHRHTYKHTLRQTDRYTDKQTDYLKSPSKWLKTSENYQKCPKHPKIFTKLPKISLKTGNICQSYPSGQCHPEAHLYYLVPTKKWA